MNDIQYSGLEKNSDEISKLLVRKIWVNFAASLEENVPFANTRYEIENCDQMQVNEQLCSKLKQG